MNRSILAVLLAVPIAVAVAAFLLVYDPGAEELRSFHFEASLEVEGQPEEGDNPADLIRGWYLTGDRWRWEFDYNDPLLSGTGATLLSDGEALVFYDGATNTYTRQRLPDEFRRNPGFIPTVSILLGPLPGDSLSGFMSSREGFDWRSAGSEEVAGRDTEVLEASLPGGTLRLWVDTDYLFALRYRAESYGLDDRPVVIDATVTRVEYNPSLDAGLFVFEPPPDSRELPAGSAAPGGSTSTGTLGGPGVPDPPEGFLRPEYVPEGLAVTGTSLSESSAGVVTAFDLTFGAPGSDPVLVIEQQFRAGGLRDALVQGTPVALDGGTGFEGVRDGEARLVFARGDIIVTVRSPVLPIEELRRIAVALR